MSAPTEGIPLDPEYDPELDETSGAAEALLNHEFGMSDADIDTYLRNRYDPPLNPEEEEECRRMCEEEELYGRVLTEAERGWCEQTGEHPDAMECRRMCEEEVAAFCTPADDAEADGLAPQKTKKPRKSRKKRDDPPEDQIIERSDDEEPNEDDNSFVNDEDPRFDVPEDGRVVDPRNMRVVFVEDKEGRRRSTRKRKATEFFGVGDEEEIYRKYTKDDEEDAEKFGEEALQEEEEDEEASVYVPTDDEDDPEVSSSSDDDDGSGDSYSPEAAYMLFGADKNGTLFMAVDEEGLILESSEDCVGDMEVQDAFKAVYGIDTKVIAKSAARVTEFYDAMLAGLPEDDRPPLEVLTAKWAAPAEIEDEEWYPEIGEVFFFAHA